MTLHSSAGFTMDHVAHVALTHFVSIATQMDTTKAHVSLKNGNVQIAIRICGHTKMPTSAPIAEKNLTGQNKNYVQVMAKLLNFNHDSK